LDMRNARNRGDTMSVTAKIPERVLRAAERRLAVNHPVVPEELPDPGGECLWLSQEPQLSIKTELAPAVGPLESGNKLTAKDAAQHLHRKKEGIAWLDPVRVIRG
jgi:hypothetical protein